MSNTYYIDSENVGDAWIDLVSIDSDNTYYLFYTGRSPRIAYNSLLHLLDAGTKPQFILCKEGNNALDFQLVTFLGYQLGSDKEQNAVIVSNDTGFDAVVTFWADRGFSIRRLTVKQIHSLENHNQSPEKNVDVSPDTHSLPAEPVEKPDACVLKGSEPDAVKGPKAGNSLQGSNTDTDPKAASKKNSKKESKKETLHNVEMTELYTIINCLGQDNTSAIHLAFVHFYGSSKGDTIYKHLKKEKFQAPPVNWKKKTRTDKFCSLIFKYSDKGDKEVPKGLVQFINSSLDEKDDKKTLQKKLEKEFGKNASDIYKILKPFVTIIVKI